MNHPKIVEAAVVAITDEKWGERPLAVVVVTLGEQPHLAQLRDHLETVVPAWQLPERWSFIDQIPKTSAGKFDKKLLRQRYATGALPIVTYP